MMHLCVFCRIVMMSMLLKRILLIVLLCYNSYALDDFVPPAADDCACPRDSVQYSCTVNDPSGDSVTRWSGTAFDCTGDQILLAHSQYNISTAAGECNDEEFTAQGLSNVFNDCYTSVLTVNTEIGLNGRTVDCSLLGAGARTIGSGTLRVAEPLPGASNPMVTSVVRDQSFTLSWDPVTNECGNMTANYTIQRSPNGACGVCTDSSNTPSVMCTGWTVVEGQNCSITIRADTDNCGGQKGEESEPVVVTLEAPQAPALIGGMAIFTNSMRNMNIIVSWNAVISTADIAASGDQVLLEGNITEYLVSFDSEQDVTTPCSSPTCSKSVSTEFPVERTGFNVSVAAYNALVTGKSAEISCNSLNRVVKTVGGSPVDVTLTCTSEPCTIRYGNSSDVYIYDGESGQALQNLEPNEKYYYQVNFSCSRFDVIVEDNFTTNENSSPSSGPSSGSLAGIIIGVVICVQLIGGVATLSVLCLVQSKKRKLKVAADSLSKSTVHQECRINIAGVLLLMLFLLIPVVGIIVFIMLLCKCSTVKIEMADATQPCHERSQLSPEVLRVTYSPVASEPPSTVAGSEAVSGVKSGSRSPEPQPEIEMTVQKQPGELLYAEVGTASRDQKHRNIIPLQFGEDQVNYSEVEVKFTGSHKAAGLQ